MSSLSGCRARCCTILNRMCGVQWVGVVIRLFRPKGIESVAHIQLEVSSLHQSLWYLSARVAWMHKLFFLSFFLCIIIELDRYHSAAAAYVMLTWLKTMMPVTLDGLLIRI